MNAIENRPSLETQTNERRCHATTEEHVLSLPRCCPVSGNPRPGSEIHISYQPDKYHLQVAALRLYVDSYQGGRGAVRSMEGMIQQIAHDCAQAAEVGVTVKADLVIAPDQRMILTCETKA